MAGKIGVSLPKCERGCTCKKHTGKSCEKGCVCKKHSSKTGRPRGGTSWNKGLKMDSNACKEGCECGKHQPSSKSCIEGCECKRHSNGFTTSWNKGKTGVYSKETLYEIGKGRRGKPAWNKGKKMPELGILMAKRRSEGLYGSSPNNLELRVAALLPEPWEFTGNKGLSIGNKCPDFWDGGTRLIEVYGNYWHQGQDPQDRINYFSEYGYECFVIWESEFNKGNTEALVNFAEAN